MPVSRGERRPSRLLSSWGMWLDFTGLTCFRRCWIPLLPVESRQMRRFNIPFLMILENLKFLFTTPWNSGNIAIYRLPLWRIWLLRLHPAWSRNHDFVLNGEGVSLLRGKRFIVFLWCFRFLIEWIFKRFGHFVWNDGISPVVLLLVGCVILRLVNLLISVTWGRTMVFSKYLFHFFVVKIIFQFVVI